MRVCHGLPRACLAGMRSLETKSSRYHEYSTTPTRGLGSLLRARRIGRRAHPKGSGAPWTSTPGPTSTESTGPRRRSFRRRG
eukprot:1309466-Alexandrium_andersonii.AAC.1